MGPTPRHTAPLLHRILGIGLAMLAAVFLVIRYVGAAPLASSDSMTPIIRYTIAGVALVALAVVLLLLKPRVPERRPSQSVDEYWSSPDVLAKVFPVWFLAEGAGVISAVGFFLTGSPASAVVMAVAIIVFWSNGPGAFGN